MGQIERGGFVGLMLLAAVHAAPAMADVRVSVLDAGTGAPLEGVGVLFEGGAAGLVTTGRDGVAAARGEPPVSVHVFRAGYDYMSIIGTASADLLVPLLQTADTTTAGGFKGTFDLSDVTNPDDSVEFGLAGASLSGEFIDLDFEKLIGESLRQRVTIGHRFDGDLAMPSGLYLKLGAQSVKGEFAALADPGLRHAWGIGGKIPFDELIQVLTPVLGGGAGAENIPFGQVIARILPLADHLRHFVRTDIPVVAVPKVPDVQDIDGDGSRDDLVPDFGDPIGFPEVTARVTEPLSLSTLVTVPRLPQYGGKFLEGAIVLAGANVTGRGLVPLGLSAALDAPQRREAPDGQVDTDAHRRGNQQSVLLKLSPLHGGLEVSPFIFVALALSLELGGSGPATVSGIIAQGDRVEPVTPLPASGFLGFPEAASFDLSTRTFTLGRPVPDARFYRADFEGPDGRWVVYFEPPAAGGPAFTLPIPPVDPDRAARRDGCPGALTTCTILRVIALATAADLDRLATSGHLARLDDAILAFSRARCQPNGSCAPPARP